MTPVEILLRGLGSDDDAIRGPAWQGAASAGPPAIVPVAALLTDPRTENARAARRALYRIVRQAGRPGGEADAKRAETELVALLKSPEGRVRRTAIALLSEIGGDYAVAPLERSLADSEVREEARQALTRIPGSEATAALRRAHRSAPDAFRAALAESLRSRGEAVSDPASEKDKKTPSKPTRVGQPDSTTSTPA